MSQLAVTGNGAGTGVFTLTSPNSNTNRTITLPDATTTLVGADATQTLTNKTIQGGTVISGTAVASTSGTSIDFTSIPSWVKRITIMLSGVSTNGTSNLQMQIGAGSIVTTGYLSSASINGSGPTGANSTTGLILTGQNAAVQIVYGSAVIFLLGSNSWASSSTLGRSDAAYSHTGGGGVTLGGTLDRIRITTVNGTDTFDAGSINILYE